MEYVETIRTGIAHPKIGFHQARIVLMKEGSRKQYLADTFCMPQYFNTLNQAMNYIKSQGYVLN